MNIKTINTKSIITKSKLPDADFVINPYIGCQHACIYCYADFMKRFTGHNNEKWGAFVDIKINSSETIKTPRLQNKTLLIGSVTDAYQQSEGKYKVTKSILEKLIDLDVNLEILTKSSLVSRDIEMFKKFKNIKIGISLNTLDNSIARKLEPYASSPSSRIKTLKKLNENGIKTYLFISPIFPKITNYKDIILNTTDFVDEFLFENLNIRGNNRESIYNFIKEHKPELLNLYYEIQKNGKYWYDLENEIIEYCNQININYKMYFYHEKIKK